MDSATSRISSPRRRRLVPSSFVQGNAYFISADIPFRLAIDGSSWPRGSEGYIQPIPTCFFFTRALPAIAHYPSQTKCILQHSGHLTQKISLHRDRVSTCSTAPSYLRLPDVIQVKRHQLRASNRETQAESSRSVTRNTEGLNRSSITMAGITGAEAGGRRGQNRTK